MNLTREQILAMPAGPEMDAAVAELVMGWRIVDCPPAAQNYKQWSGHDRIVPKESSDLACGFYPSRSIADAWQVVEKMEPATLASFPPRQWRCRFGLDSWEDEAKAATAPLAICRAALLSTLLGA